MMHRSLVALRDNQTVRLRLLLGTANLALLGLLVATVHGGPSETTRLTAQGGTSFSQTCVDSDGGEKYETAGKIYGSQVYAWDKTNLTNIPNSVIYDYCEGSTAYEGRCVENCVADGNSHCGYFNYKVCPNGCSNGACIVKPTTVTCTDSDGGKDPNVKGETKNTTGEYTADLCIGGGVYESYCDGSRVTAVQMPCANGCENGSCKKAVTIDSDFFHCAIIQTSWDGETYVYQVWDNTTGKIDAKCHFDAFRVIASKGEAYVHSGGSFDGMKVTATPGSTFTAYADKNGHTISRYVEVPDGTSQDCVITSSVQGSKIRFDIRGTGTSQQAYCRFDGDSHVVLSGSPVLLEMTEFSLTFDGTKTGKLRVLAAKPSTKSMEYEIKGSGTAPTDDWLPQGYCCVPNDATYPQCQNLVKRADCEARGGTLSEWKNTGMCATCKKPTPAPGTTPAAGYEDDILTNDVGTANPFSDTDITTVEGMAAAALYAKGVIGGYADGTFQGKNTVKRAEAAKFLLLARYGTVPEMANNGRYPDVIDGQWYTKYVMKAAELGIMGGSPDGLFRPADTVNTAELLKMISITFDQPTGAPFTYADVSVDDWYAQYAAIAQMHALFPNRAVGFLFPERELTREEVAIAIWRMID